MLRSAIENVVRNAIRYTPDGASVEITIEQPNGDDDQKAILRIRDHGPGVPKIMLANIFLPFQRVPETADINSGAGLGLAIADRVVRMHNGNICAVNASDGGLIVEIVLPIASEVRP
jgi:two-component system sensor histidine kinase CpxA